MSLSGNEIWDILYPISAKDADEINVTPEWCEWATIELNSFHACNHREYGLRLLRVAVDLFKYRYDGNSIASVMYLPIGHKAFRYWGNEDAFNGLVVDLRVNELISVYRIADPEKAHWSPLASVDVMTLDVKGKRILENIPGCNKPPAIYDVNNPKGQYDLSRFANVIHACGSVRTENSNILLLGETGSGKTYYASVIHKTGNTDKSSGQLVTLDCSPYSKDPKGFAAELHGYGQGAYTGAKKEYPGKIREAENGTLFLDEIGYLDEDALGVLLTVMQDRTARPLQGKEKVVAKIRIIAATNKTKAEMLEKNSALVFRFDEIIQIPPLRHNKPLLQDRVIDLFAAAKTHDGRSRLTLGKTTIRDLENSLYRWPGNVRQLEKAIPLAVTRKTGLNSNPGLTAQEIIEAAKEFE